MDSVRFSGRQRSRVRRGSARVITASVTLRISSSASSRSLMSSCDMEGNGVAEDGTGQQEGRLGGAAAAAVAQRRRQWCNDTAARAEERHGGRLLPFWVASDSWSVPCVWFPAQHPAREVCSAH